MFSSVESSKITQTAATCVGVVAGRVRLTLTTCNPRINSRGNYLGEQISPRVAEDDRFKTGVVQ